MKIKLHIGANKTGSSALQRFIQKNVRVLSDYDIYVPSQKFELEGNVTGEHVFALQAIMDSHDPAGSLSSRLDTFEAQGIETLLISAENLSNLGSAEKVGAAFANFDTQALLYIRRQDELLLSSWQQWGSKTSRNFQRWLDNAFTTTGLWATTIEAWESYLGDGKVDVRVFERDHLKDGDIQSDALDFIAPGLQQADVEFIKGVNPNPSFWDSLIPLVAGSNQIFDGPHDNNFYREMRWLLGDFYTSGKKVSTISQKKREDIIAQYDEENETVRSRFFNEHSALFRPVNHDKYRYTNGNQAQTDQMRFLAHAIYEITQKLHELEKG